MADSNLSIELRAAKPVFRNAQEIELKALYTNKGSTPLSLTFWWNRRMRVVDSSGATITPGAGPVLPCGVREDVVVLKPGESLDRDEYVGCTQPAGDSRPVGWSYALGAGVWKVTLLFAFPPAHGRIENEDAQAWRGSVESNTVTFSLEENAPVPAKSFWKKLFSRHR
jgi:hypothetical protein